MQPFQETFQNTMSLYRKVLVVSVAALLFICCVFADNLKEKCKELDRKIGTIDDKDVIRPKVERMVTLLEGEPLLISDHANATDKNFDIVLNNAIKDAKSKVLLKTIIQYIDQRFIMRETKHIPNGMATNFKCITKALQFSESAKAGYNLYSVARQITDPMVRSTMMRFIHQSFPEVDCNFDSS